MRRFDADINPSLVVMEHSCRLTMPLFIYLEKEYGPEAADIVAERAGLPRDYLMDEHNWMSHEFYKRILEELVAYTGDDRSPFKAGLYAATPEGYGHMYWLLRAFGSPSMVYKQVVKMVPQYTKVARYNILHLSHNHLKLELKHNPGYCPSKLTCLDATGELASIVSVWGGPPATVVEHQCQADGADVCIYEFHWTNQPRSLLRILGVLAGGALVATDLILGPRVLIAEPWLLNLLPMAGVVGLGYLAGWVVELHRSNAWNAELAQELDRALIESMEAVEVKFSQLRAAQEDLGLANEALEIKNSELRNLYDHVTETYENLKRLDEKKTEFLRIVAHDLKTPLASLRTYAAMLNMYDDLEPEESREFLETIEKESVRLAQIIDRFLDLTRIESGTLNMVLSEVDLHAMLDHISHVFRTTAEGARLELCTEISPDLGSVRADESRLGQVVSNLLANACKFTPPGGTVVLAARPREDQAGVEICVTDTGPGIPAELGDQVYERFFVSEGSNGKRGLTGQGLGLYIASQVVEGHGGSLWHVCPPEGGTRFYLHLPPADAQ